MISAKLKNMLVRYGMFLFEVARRYVLLRGNFYAKAMAFSFLLTFIPIVMVFLWGISVFLSHNQELQHLFITQLIDLVPPAASDFLRDRIYEIIKSRSWRNLGIFGVIILFWAPNSLFSSILYGLHVMMEKRHTDRFVWSRHLFTFTMHYIVALIVVLLNLLSLVINSVFTFENAPFWVSLVKSHWISTMVLFTVLAAIYVMSYGRAINKWALVSVSLILAVLWHVFNYAGSKIISGSGGVEVFYGIFAGVAVVMTWSLVFSAAILLGGIIIAQCSPEPTNDV
jgi:YihY family inner membrane protein